MGRLASVSADVEASLAEVQSALQEERTKERDFQQIFGPRPNSIILELEKETQKYHEAHSMASESNLTLNKAMRLHVKNLRLLSLSPAQLEAEIPSLSGGLSTGIKPLL
jgi:tyrosine-protein phosphatase non-receptor type 23